MPERFVVSLFLATLLTAAAHAAGTGALPSTAACSARSNPVATTALLELFTAEGCPHCPQAETWLAQLPKKGFGLASVVPLALHVDYWNEHGWVDPFAQEAFTQRQYRYALLNGTIVVYTPQFVLNGREYFGWQHGTFAEDLARLNAMPARAEIALRLERRGTTLRIEVEAAVPDPVRRPRTGLLLALYENRLANRITAGENRGRTLHHDYVVRRLLGPFPLGESEVRAHFEQEIALDPAWKAADLGVAAFVQERTSGEVLQALALPLCH
jgi:hypothetical protein